MKKLITIQKSDDAADFADLPKIDEYINFKKTIMESGKVTYWDRTEFIDNKSVITIECDSEETFDDLVDRLKIEDPIQAAKVASEIRQSVRAMERLRRRLRRVDLDDSREEVDNKINSILFPTILNPAVPVGSGSWITPFTDIKTCCGDFGKGAGETPETCKGKLVVLPLKLLLTSSINL